MRLRKDHLDICSIVVFITTVLLAGSTFYAVGKAQELIFQATGKHSPDFGRVQVWVFCFAVMVLSAELALVTLIYRRVLSPLRSLGHWAERLFLGDTDLRIQVLTGDEIEVVAEALNRAVDRFAEFEEILSMRVEERSRQLVRSERLASVGLLAAGVAHEINNPLAAAFMAAQSVSRRLEEIDEAARSRISDFGVIQDYLRMMEAECSRCRKITRNLLEMSQHGDEERLDCDLTELVQKVMAMAKHFSEYSDRTIHFTEESPHVIECNPSEIQQVILNLVMNGLQATGSGGNVTIEFESHLDHVTLRVSDDGVGMTEEVISQVFEPFFTSRLHGGGTGLGLSVIHQIVEQHRGTIVPFSEGDQRGSTFKVTLPRRSTPREKT